MGLLLQNAGEQLHSLLPALTLHEAHDDGDEFADHLGIELELAEAAREERLDTYVSERESLLQWRSALIEERDQLVAERDALLAASGSDLRELAGLTDDQSALTVEAIKHQRDTALRALADVEGSRVWRMSGPYRRARQTWARRGK